MGAVPSVVNQFVSLAEQWASLTKRTRQRAHELREPEGSDHLLSESANQPKLLLGLSS